MIDACLTLWMSGYVSCSLSSFRQLTSWWQKQTCSLWQKTVSSSMARKFPLYSALLHIILCLLEEGNKAFFLQSFSSTQPFFNCDGECACGITAMGILLGTRKSGTYFFSCQPTSNRVTADRWSFSGIMERAPSVLPAPVPMGHPGSQVWLLPQNAHSRCF